MPDEGHAVSAVRLAKKNHKDGNLSTKPTTNGSDAKHTRCSRTTSTDRRCSSELLDRVGVGSVAVRDEVGGGGHTAIGHRAQIPCGGEVAGLGRDASQCVEGEDLDVGVVVVTGLIEDCDETLLRAGIPFLDVDGGEQTFAERSLLATSGGAVGACPGRGVDRGGRTRS